MEKPIIEIKNVGKRYNITHQRGGYVALRDVLMNILKSPFYFLKKKVKQVAGFDKKEEFWALKNVSFNVNKGDVVGIIGANGAGKSTLLKILSQITPPTEGEIILRGRVGSLLEVGTGFHPELTGRENIFLNGAILGMKRKEISEKFDEIVEFAGIGKFLDTPVKYYSSGMYVRLAFSVAAHMESDILIIDEVLAVGDAEFQKKCLGKMEEITRGKGRTILFVSHNMPAILNLCKKSLVLQKGHIVYEGETREAISQYLKSDKLAKPQVTIGPTQHNRGNKESFITEVSLSSDVGQKNNFAINEPITIGINYKTEKTDHKISFWLLFSNQSGEVIVNSFQKDSNILIDPSMGNHRIEIKIEKLVLMPGRYSITAGIFSHDSENKFEFADWVDQCQSFEISRSFYDGKNFDGRMGMITQEASWNVIK